MFGTNKRYIAVCLQEASVKVAQVLSSGVVEKVARATAADASVDSVGKILKTALNGFDRKASIVCVIPSSAATAKNIEVPSSDPQEIRSIINLQASRHTPYSREEVLISYLPLGNSANGNTKILLVIAHRNMVKDRLTAMEKAGLDTDKVIFAPEGMARFYGKSGKKDAAPAGLIDIAEHHTNFLVLSKGQVAFSRAIPIGTADLGEPSSSAKIIEELNKSLATYQGEDVGAAISEFLLTTDFPAVKDLMPALGESLKADVRLSLYTQLLKSGGAIKKKLEKDFVGDSFLEVIGAGIFAGNAVVQLMPEEILIKRSVEEQSRQATKAGLCALCIMLLIGGMLMSKIYFKDMFLEKNLREQYAPQKEEVKRLEARMAKAQVVRDYLNSRMVSLETLRELYKITPTAIYLSSINLDDAGNVTIAGISPSMSQVFTYVKSLDDSALFKEAKTKSTATKKDDGKDVAAFEIVMKLQDAKE